MGVGRGPGGPAGTGLGNTTARCTVTKGGPEWCAEGEQRGRSRTFLFLLNQQFHVLHIWLVSHVAWRVVKYNLQKLARSELQESIFVLIFPYKVAIKNKHENCVRFNGIN